jgi:hypothetical protein
MLIISKSFENFLQAMSGVTFGKSPNGTAFAERVTFRHNARARFSNFFLKLLYRRYIASCDIAAFLLSEPGFTGLRDVHDFAMRRKNPVRDDISVEKDNSKFKIQNFKDHVLRKNQ